MFCFVVVVLMDTSIEILHFRPISSFFQHIAPLHAAFPGSLSRQPFPAAFPGSLSRQACPAGLPGSLAWQPCPAALPGSLARQPGPAEILQVF
jgi:hypothetical protein